MSIQTIITQVAALQAEITGVKRAHDETPDGLNEFPCFVNFISTGDSDRSPNRRHVVHHIKMQLRVCRADRPSAENLVRPFLLRTYEKFDDNITLNGSATRSAIVHYDYGNLPWSGTNYLGISFDLDVWEDTAYAFSG